MGFGKDYNVAGSNIVMSEKFSPRRKCNRSIVAVHLVTHYNRAICMNSVLFVSFPEFKYKVGHVSVIYSKYGKS